MSVVPSRVEKMLPKVAEELEPSEGCVWLMPGCLRSVMGLLGGCSLAGGW